MIAAGKPGNYLSMAMFVLPNFRGIMDVEVTFMSLRISLALVGALLIALTTFLLITPSESQAGGSFVALQSTTPGTSQSGNTNISGKARMGSFQMATGAGASKVLTSDGSGNGTWQDASGISIPYSGTFNTASRLLTLTNEGFGNILFAHSNSGGSGTAIVGRSDGNTSVGVYGWASSGDLSSGVYGASNGIQGRGIQGYANNAGFAIYGIADGAGGRGIYGRATATSGQNFGIWAEAAGHQAIGVYGAATHETGVTYAVYGLSSSPTNGYGVFAVGRTGATGTKSFRIDHPQDPENKYLLHYASEGPQPFNIYSDTARLDKQGSASVELPDYFEDINRNPRILLTAIGSAMPNLHVSEKVSNNRFRISGGSPYGEVTWEVKAVRNDRYMQAYGAPVEIEKPEGERGTYQHPELYGLPPSRGLNFHIGQKQLGTR